MVQRLAPIFIDRRNERIIDAVFPIWSSAGNASNAVERIHAVEGSHGPTSSNFLCPYGAIKFRMFTPVLQREAMGGDLYSEVLTLSFQSILWEKTEGGKQELVEEPYFSHIRSGKKGRIVGIERSGNHPIPPGDPRRLSDPSVGCQGTLPDFRGCIGEQETELVWSFQPISLLLDSVWRHPHPGNVGA